MEVGADLVRMDRRMFLSSVPGKSRIHGFGIFTKHPHRVGDMVIEYTGELVRPSIADRRERFIYSSVVGIAIAVKCGATKAQFDSTVGIHPSMLRVSSLKKDNYDLCNICFARMGNNIDYIRIYRPVSYRQSRSKGLYNHLPGLAILSEGKPENHNHAITFTRGDGLQTIDMNQDNYMEESFKMRNLLQVTSNVTLLLLAYNGRSPNTQISCRTDRSGLISADPWISFPNPIQWGTPNVYAGDVFMIMAAAFVALIESTGTFIAASRLASATPVSPSILSRGATPLTPSGWLGIGLLINDLFGAITGPTALVENTGLLGLTRVGS